ncbi:MAG: hypothetical protein ACKPKO_52455, partial [Candidatus Fonsibacter sp.]
MTKSLAMRQSIREMVKEAIKEDFPPRPPYKAMPKLPSAKAASVAAVIKFASGRECLQRSTGGAEQKTFDEIFDWKMIEVSDGVFTHYRNIGPPTFSDYLQRAYWDALPSFGETGYEDLGWKRRATFLEDESVLVDSLGRRHQVGDLTLYVPNTQELRGISVCDLRHHLGLLVGRAAYSSQSDEHTIARLISGILRHSGSVTPPKDRRPSPANGFGL